jgi:undecaprenyl-diphosphatase
MRLPAALLSATLACLTLAPSGVSAGEPPPAGDVTVGQAAILGVVEGVTEYLPVSSTGHLILTQRIMGIGATKETRAAANAFVIVIQLGAILAVLGLYRSQVVRMLNGLLGRDPGGRRLFFNLVAAFIPAAIAGLLLDDLVEGVLFGLWPIAAAWIAGGLVILVAFRGWKNEGGADAPDLLDNLTLKQAVGVGVFQCLALWPGMSRSFSTILGGRVMGLGLRASVVFSFLLGVMTLGAVTCLVAVKKHEILLAHVGASSMAAGLAAAFLSAVVSVRWMVGYLNRRGLAVFGWYRLALGAVVMAALAAGWLPNR